MSLCLGGEGWQGGFMYTSYREKGGSPKSCMQAERREGKGGPKSKTELRKYFMEDP